MVSVQRAGRGPGLKNQAGWWPLPLLSVLVAAAGLYFSWRNKHDYELRQGDVLAWANEVIAELQTLALVCQLTEQHIGHDTAKQKITDVIFNTSILVERGRLFFRNTSDGAHGKEKPHAYRGRRPVILDQLVLAHQIACAWPGADADTRRAMAVVAEDVLQRFVSLVQMEVGRMRTASADTRRRGDGTDLEWRLRHVDPLRMPEETVSG